MACVQATDAASSSGPAANPAEIRATTFISDRMTECVHSELGQDPLQWVNTGTDGEALKKDDAVSAGKRQACKALEHRATPSDDVECLKMSNDDTGAPNGPYDVMLLNAGSDVFRFVNCKATNEPQLLQELAADRWLSRIPSFLRPLVSCAADTGTARMFALPVGLHRLNQLYLNQERLQATGLTWSPASLNGAAPSSLDQFLVLLGQLRERGCALPVVIEDKDWPWSLLLVENIMVSIAGADTYEQFWKQLPKRVGDTIDLSDLDSDRRATTVKAVDEGFAAFEQAVDYAQRLASYVQVQVNPMALVQEPGLCAEGLPIFTVMGDWDVPNITVDTVQAVPFPGTEGTYVYTADAFAIPQSNEPAVQADAAATLWFEVVSDPLIQLRYAGLKGSLPLVTEQGTVPTEGELFGDQRPVPGLPGFVPSETFNEFLGKLTDLMHATVNDSAAGRSDDAATRAARRVDLVTYIQEEYCDKTGFCEFVPASMRSAACTQLFESAPNVVATGCLVPEMGTTSLPGNKLGPTR